MDDDASRGDVPDDDDESRLRAGPKKRSLVGGDSEANLGDATPVKKRSRTLDGDEPASPVMRANDERAPALITPESDSFADASDASDASMPAVGERLDFAAAAAPSMPALEGAAAADDPGGALVDVEGAAAADDPGGALVDDSDSDESLEFTGNVLSTLNKHPWLILRRPVRDDELGVVEGYICAGLIFVSLVAAIEMSAIAMLTTCGERKIGG